MVDDRLCTDTATPEMLARRGLRRRTAQLADQLHDAVEQNAPVEVLHDIIGLWDVNQDDLTFIALVELGSPTSCSDCAADVTPYDDDGRPSENGWEWYMVHDHVWDAAHAGRPLARYLCVGCLEQRLGQRLTPEDFSDYDINAPSWMSSTRLAVRQGHLG
jgi:hypothetical protein